MGLVSLSPSLTEILAALGAADKVTEFPSKPIEFGKIEALSPEWVLADSRDNRPEEIQVVQRKWKTKVFDVKRPEEVCDAAAELGRLVHRRHEAGRLIQALRDEMGENQKIFAAKEKRRTVLLLWNQPFITVNFDAYPSRLLEASGGLNVFREDPLLEFPVEMEDMIEKNPELLLLSGGPGPFRARHVSEFRRYRIFNRIPIHLIDGTLLTCYGPQTVEALKQFRGIYEGLQ